MVISLESTIMVSMENENHYVIIWASRLKDRSGIGQKHFSQSEAAALTLELNSEHPDILHSYVDVSTEDPIAELNKIRMEIAEHPQSSARPMVEHAQLHALLTPEPALADQAA